MYLMNNYYDNNTKFETISEDINSNTNEISGITDNISINTEDIR